MWDSSGDSIQLPSRQLFLLLFSRQVLLRGINASRNAGDQYHNLWDVIVNGDLEEEPAPITGETSAPPAPKTAKQLAARRNQERVKSILLLAIPDEYLLKFHNVADAKSLWEVIKSRFGGNVESKKMQEKCSKIKSVLIYLLHQNVRWDKAYVDSSNDKSMEVHGCSIYQRKSSTQEVLRSSNSASQNLAFLSSENTGNTNEVSTTSGDFGVSTAGGINQVPSTLCAHDIDYSFLAQPTTSPQLGNEDFQQMDRACLDGLDY
ncbi:hypothetical protein Tco_0328128 [Tanacetum coccineum]